MQQAPHTLAERVLSKNICDRIGLFFADVLNIAKNILLDENARPVLIAVITRRCFVMFFFFF